MTVKRILPLSLSFLLAATTLAFSLQSTAETLTIKDDAPSSYTVVKGDTLWGISGRYLDKPWLWPELWQGNPQITNPHLIYPGDVISLSYENGQPRLHINRSTQNVKLAPQIRETRIDNAIPTVPIATIQQFLRNLKVLDKASMEKAPYVISGQEGRILTAIGDRIYVKGLQDAAQTDYQIYHLGDPINDPDTGETIAHEGLFVADAKLETAGDPSRLLVTTSKREIAIGDRLISTESGVQLTDFYPKVPSTEVKGKILNVVDGTGIIGRHQAVIINLGKTDGIARGDVLSTFTKEETVPDRVSKDLGDSVTLPQERSGTLMVIRPFEKLSYALVMESRLPIHIKDEVKTPQ